MRIFYLLRLRSLKLMWSSDMESIWELRHPLRKCLPQREEITPERLTYCWMMHMRMWEHPLLSAGRGGHLRGTLDTWILWENVL